MSKIRVTWTNVIEIDTDEWREVAGEHLDSTDFSDGAIVDEVLGLFDVEERTPRWARDAIRKVNETTEWK
jgi:hypothetical protein